MEKMNDLNDLLKHEIEDLYSVEEQIIDALPKMAEKANDKSLKNALTEHLKATREHKKRLDKVQQMLNMGGADKGKEGKKGLLSGIFGGGKHVCKGMQGIIEEGNKMLSGNMSPQVLDAAIVACAQKVEHYEICGYGTARTYADQLGLHDVATLLEQTLSEEYTADDLLTQMARRRINLEAGVPAKGNERTASGATRSRTGAGSSTATRRQQPALEAVSAKRSATKSSSNSRGSSAPQSAEAPRSSGNGRGTASRKAAASKTSSAAAKSGSRSSSRSASGRGSAGSRNR